MRFRRKVKAAAVCFVLGCVAVDAAAEEGEAMYTPFGKTVREVQSLSGPWEFALAQGADPRDASSPPEGLDWKPAAIPASFNDLVPEDPRFEGAGWYRRTFTPPLDWVGKRVVMRFGAVNNSAAVFVNNKLVRRFERAYLPEAVDVTEALRYGEKNTVAVLADSTRRDDRLPNGVWTLEKAQQGGGGLGLAWHGAGGIIREVILYATSPTYVRGVRVNGVPTAAGGRMEATAAIANGAGKTFEGEVVAVLSDADGNERAHAVQEVSVRRGRVGEVAFRIDLPDADLWSPEAPALYTCEILLASEEGTLDSRSTRFGFRRVYTGNGKLMLNGAPLFLVGFNRHDDSPTRWAAPDFETARNDVQRMKDMGANYVRLAHYPNHPRVLDFCDEIGLVVMAEIPLFWWRGRLDGEANYNAIMQAARIHLTEMIARDYNHPSIIFWSVGNEWQTQRPGVREGTERLIRHVKAEDDTRLAMHVSDHWRHMFDAADYFGEDDVIAITGYPDPPTAEWWVEGIERLSKQYPGKPVLLTELGGYTVEQQLAAFEAAVEAIRRAETCGFAAWAWADYPGSREMGDAPTTFGAYTRDRAPRPEVVAALEEAFAEAREAAEQYGY